MSFVIVPNALSEEIYRKVDAAITAAPESHHLALKKERDRFYGILLEHFDEHGNIPEFSLTDLSGHALNGGAENV